MFSKDNKFMVLLKSNWPKEKIPNRFDTIIWERFIVRFYVFDKLFVFSMKHFLKRFDHISCTMSMILLWSKTLVFECFHSPIEDSFVCYHMRLKKSSVFSLHLFIYQLKLLLRNSLQFNKQTIFCELYW